MGPDTGSEAIPPSRAVALGIVQGPAELLPVSSSAHLSLIPWLAGWDWDRYDPELRKSFEVALHAGAAAALLVGQRHVIAEELSTFDRRKATVLALSFLTPAALGLALERPVERHLGGPLPTAIGLIAGAVAMAIADRRPQTRKRDRTVPMDGLALGLAQAAALAPGVSRNGATLTAARWRGFSREHANMLSRTVALPVIVARQRAEGGAAAPARAAPGAAQGLRRRHGRLVRLDPRLAGADQAGRARQRPLALRRVPHRARRPRARSRGCAARPRGRRGCRRGDRGNGQPTNGYHPERVSAASAGGGGE